MIEKFIIPDARAAGYSSEECRKRVYVFVGIALSLPVLLGYSLTYLLYAGRPLLAIPDLGLAAYLVIIAARLRKVHDGRTLYRLAMAGITLLLLYDMGAGLHEGGDILWLYIYPLVALYMFGKREGFFWVAALLLPSGVFVFAPHLADAYNYPGPFRSRFVVSMLLVIFLAYLNESLRAYFYRRLEEQGAELREALVNVKQLKGLLPICASCKSIRNDEGCWELMEEYISTHTDATFSHGICDSCLKQDHPEVYARLKGEGKINGTESEPAGG